MTETRALPEIKPEDCDQYAGEVIEPKRPRLTANSRTGQPLPRIADGSADRWLGKEPTPLEFTIEDLVPEGMVTLFVADGGAGKSLLAQLAMACFPTGKCFLGKTTKPGAAVGIFAEDPDQVLHIRQVRINKLIEIDMEDLGGWQKWGPGAPHGSSPAGRYSSWSRMATRPP